MPNKKKKGVENPKRVERFFANTSSLDWSNKRASINTLNAELELLFIAEIKYYFKRRRERKALSTKAMKAIIFFTTIGALCPVVDVALISYGLEYELSKWGYVAFVLAGTCLTYDKVFTGSSGYIRYTSSQLKLEEIYALHRVKWNALLAMKDIDQDPDVYFNALIDLCEKAYKTIGDETSIWVEEIKEAIKEFKNSNISNNQ